MCDILLARCSLSTGSCNASFDHEQTHPQKQTQKKWSGVDTIYWSASCDDGFGSERSKNICTHTLWKSTLNLIIRYQNRSNLIRSSVHCELKDLDCHILWTSIHPGWGNLNGTRSVPYYYRPLWNWIGTPSRDLPITIKTWIILRSFMRWELRNVECKISVSSRMDTTGPDLLLCFFCRIQIVRIGWND